MSRKKCSFTELERLIKQAQKTKKKANQQLRRAKKEAQTRLNKQDPKQSPYFTPHLDLSPHLAQRAYQEELISQANQLKYYKDKIGSLNPSTKEFLKSEQFKYFFPEKGEHKELFRRRKEFIAEREKILTEFKGQQVKSLNKYFKNNTDYPFSYSRKHYLRAIGKMLRKTGHEGELVPDSEIELDKYGNPKFKKGQ
ncbi:151_t:CDS:2 [Racocetra persica]|uniref:151_t:CDS:1 n=1 Tax=Racocetra persica TaxID=160502 RepID=A0ACA9RL06_9GLOM|nr:151_t:CDS:2 [Racocetra persica]